jgi:hypothetical protein
MKRLADEPEPRAQRDGVHLTPRGYRELGDRLFDVLVEGMPELPPAPSFRQGATEPSTRVQPESSSRR